MLSFTCSTGILAAVDPTAEVGRSIPVTTPALRGQWRARATIQDGRTALEAWHTSWKEGDKQGLALEGMVQTTSGHLALFDVHSSFIALRNSVGRCLARIEEAVDGACLMQGAVEGILMRASDIEEIYIKKRGGVAVYIAIPARKELHDPA